MNYKQIIKFFTFAVFISLFLSSCIVTKKKYEEMMSKKNKSIDSLQTEYNGVVDEYNDSRNELAKSNAFKTNMIDSLNISVDQLTSDTTQLKADLKEAIASYEQERQKLIGLQQESEQLNTKLANMQQVLKEKQQRLNELEKMIETNKKQMSKLQKTIADALIAFDNTELSVYQKDGKVYVSLDEKLLFSSGSAKVGAQGKKALVELGKVLEKNPDIKVTIEGHTDVVGSSEYNWDLSVKRATAIVKILENNSNIDPKRLTAAGHGEYMPVDTADSDEARQKNRRTEIILTPELDELYHLLNEDIK